MARQIDIGELPSGVSLTAEVFAMGGNTLIEAITLTERSVAKCSYTGTIATASGAEYRLAIKQGSSYIGATTAFIGATDGVTYYARDGANVMEWLGTAPATPATAGVPKVNVTHWVGTAVVGSAGTGTPLVCVGYWQDTDDTGDESNVKTTDDGSQIPQVGVRVVYDNDSTGYRALKVDASNNISATGGSGLDAAGVRAAVGLASANLDAQLSAIDDFLDTEVAAIKAKTDLIPAAPASTTNITAATGIVLSGVTHTGAVIPTVSAVTGLTASNLDATVSSRASQATLDTLDDYVDTEVAAIKAKTDQFVFTVANQVDANALSGGGTGLDAAQTRAALGLASANLDTQLGDLPTNAELATALGTSDDAMLAAIAALNNLSSAQVASLLTILESDLATDHGAGSWATATGFATVNPDNTSITAIKAKTDNLPSDPADQSAVEAAITAATIGLSTAANLALVKTDTAAILLDTDSLDTTKLTTARAAKLDEITAARMGALTDWIDGGRLDLLLDAIPASSATAILAAGDVDGYTVEQTLKLCLSALAGKLSGAATATVTIRAADDSKARITATVTADGDRTAISYDATG